MEVRKPNRELPKGSKSETKNSEQLLKSIESEPEKIKQKQSEIEIELERRFRRNKI
ncbi:MAG: hypothetical protein CM15mP111_3330 [Hyphomicrobiales bacterium]|nr:MAG: hypothetical protein CM15mP111_3330 [Hyphomicrobiales bacterium]